MITTEAIKESLRRAIDAADRKADERNIPLPRLRVAAILHLNYTECHVLLDHLEKLEARAGASKEPV